MSDVAPSSLQPLVPEWSQSPIAPHVAAWLTDHLAEDEALIGAVESRTPLEGLGALWIALTDQRVLLVAASAEQRWHRETPRVVEAPRSGLTDLADTLPWPEDLGFKLEGPRILRGVTRQLWEAARLEPGARLLGAAEATFVKQPEEALALLLPVLQRLPGLSDPAPTLDAAQLRAALLGAQLHLHHRQHREALTALAQAVRGASVDAITAALKTLPKRANPIEELIYLAQLRCGPSEEARARLERARPPTRPSNPAEALWAFGHACLALEEADDPRAAELFERVLDYQRRHAQDDSGVAATITAFSSLRAAPPRAGMLAGFGAHALRQGRGDLAATLLSDALQLEPLLRELYAPLLRRLALQGGQLQRRRALAEALRLLDTAIHDALQAEGVLPPPPEPALAEDLTLTKERLEQLKHPQLSLVGILQEKLHTLVNDEATASLSLTIQQHCVRVDDKHHPELQKHLQAVCAQLGYLRPLPCYLSGQRLGGLAFVQPDFILLGDLHLGPDAAHPLTDPELRALLATLVFLVKSGIPLAAQEEVNETTRDMALAALKTGASFLPYVGGFIKLAEKAGLALRVAQNLSPNALVTRARALLGAGATDDLYPKGGSLHGDTLLADASFYAVASGDRAALEVSGDLHTVAAAIFKTSRFLASHAERLHSEGLHGVLEEVTAGLQTSPVDGATLGELALLPVLRRLRELLLFHLQSKP